MKIIVRQFPLYEKWVNAGGQIIPEQKLYELFDLIKNRKINSWDEVHDFYDKCQKNYLMYKVTYSIHLLESLYCRKIRDFSQEIFDDIISDVTAVSNEMLKEAFSSREKDYVDEFRKITFRNDEEMKAVIGNIEDNSFLSEMKESTQKFNQDIKEIFDIS